MTWLSLSHSQAVGSDLLLRFRPDAFAPEQEAPVIVVAIEGAEDPESALTRLARFRDDFIVDLVVEAQKLRLLGEMDDEETIILGTKVTLSRAPYSADELRQAAVFFERRLREETSHGYRQESRIRDLRHFIADLIERAERKQSLGAKGSELTEAQLSVLHRVLNRLDAA